MSWLEGIDLSEVTEELKEMADNNSDREYEEVPCGKYEVKCLGIELTESKAGKTMLKFEYQILAGDYKNSHIWQYQNLQHNNVKTVAFFIHLANDFLKSMFPESDSSRDTITFENPRQYKMLIDAISDTVTSSYEYVLEMYENKKGYKQYRICDIFDAEN